MESEARDDTHENIASVVESQEPMAGAKGIQLRVEPELPRSLCT